MNWNAFPGIACIVSLLLPVVVILYNRFYKHRSLTALLVYYLFTALYLMVAERWIPLSESFRIKFGVVVNYMDAPLMLTTLLFFCPIKQKQKLVRSFVFIFISYEFLISFIYGFNQHSIVLVSGPGLLIVLIYSFYLFVRQVKFTIMHGKNLGRTVMLISILFGYSCYGLIYYFYYIQKTPFKSDTLLLYFISTFISSIVMTVGLHLMRKRIKEFQLISVTRKELAMFFAN